MRKIFRSVAAFGLAPLAAVALSSVAFAQPPRPGPDVYKLEDNYLQWPVPEKGKRYLSIDGKKLHGYVEEITAISRRYRDQGNQLWGRLEGTSSDVESAAWMADKLRKAGAEVRLQPLDLPPQWLPKSWEVSTTAGGKLTSAQPATRSVGTDGKALDLELVYVGLGTEADYKGRDVRGKAVLVYTMPQTGVWGNSGNYSYAASRARDAGAAVVIQVVTLPGNIGTQYAIFRDPPAAQRTAPAAKAVPGFTLGLADGDSLIKQIAQAPADQPVRIKVSLDATPVPGLKTQLVWGVIPGMSDEQIVVVAHRDGWFEGAGDNASGMATAVGLAEYFAKIPKAQRKRTIVILGSSGHHGTQVGVQWLADNKETALAKTVLVMNAEHTALTQQYQHAGQLRAANTTTALHWDFNGSRKLIDAGIEAFNTFGVATYTGTDGVAMAEIGPVRNLTTSFGVIDVDTYYHSDQESADKVPWTGLGSITRAFAKMIDNVNAYSAEDLKRPK